jgi:low affinity Fe/Cu permease
LFMLTMGSARLNGYRLYQDLWIRLAIAVMLLLCLILVLSTIF